jgi:hypothetical protein
VITDLSHLAADGPWITSQSGNMDSANTPAMTGPGSPPAGADRGAPTVVASDHVPVGTPPGRVATAS